MDYYQEYQRWRRFPGMDQELKKELEQIAGLEEEIQDRFGRELVFGTGGIRGTMGAGPARINIYLIRKATAGLAAYLRESCSDEKISVAIAFDTRRNSNRFAREAAAVLAEQGIEAWVFPEPAPTPLLSFAVRKLKAHAGIVITASHNPPPDNGYKVYGADGGQITDAFAHAVMAKIAEIPDELSVPVLDLAEAEAKGLLHWIPEHVDDEYVRRVRQLSTMGQWWRDDMQSIKAVFTPLHGTGGRHLPAVFDGFSAIELIPVPEQMIMDASCPTVRYPNPEDWEVFEMAKNLGKEQDADLLMATDLDADRLGVAVRGSSGDYIPLTGNQLGCVMLEYILSQKKKSGKLSANGLMVQTVVTSELGKEIAGSYNIETVETLTGFKYIGEVIKQRVDTGQNKFLFGYEESYGYLMGDFVRDKDGLQAALFAAEAASFYKNEGKTLLEALETMYKKHGYFFEDLININLPPGKNDQVDRMMTRLRDMPPVSLGGSQIERMYDYGNQKERNCLTGRDMSINLPVSNSIKFVTQDRSWFCVRPSGTEPKMKIYYGVRSGSQEAAREKKETVGEEIRTMLGLG